MSKDHTSLWNRFLLEADAIASRIGSVLRPGSKQLKHKQSSSTRDLEQRLLFSATPIDPGIIEALDSELLVSQVQRSNEGTAQASEIASNSSTQSETKRSLVFINSDVPDVELLLDDLMNSRPDASVFVLDSDRDGVEQISEILDGRSESDIHIVSHSEDGAVRLGSTWLSVNNLNGYAGQIAGWHSSLSSDADILFYGCDLAETQDGRDLIGAIAALTEADIAASDDDTGHSRFGADWDLEYTTGVIESEVAFTDHLQQVWQRKLATITVNTLTDEFNGGATISLREAIDQASSGDTIVLDSGIYRLTLGNSGDDSGSEGDLDITKDLFIEGSADGSTIISGEGNDRVFHIINSSLTMSDVTIESGNITDKGGGIFAKGTSSELTLNRVIVQNNFGDEGAGIFNEGTMTLTDVVIANNGDKVGTNEGGGIHNKEIAILNRVTVSENEADTGGGIHNDYSGGTSITMTNVTVSGNTAAAGGGGLYSQNTATIINSTFTLNTADSGGGIRVQAGDTTITNTIVAGNSATSANDDVQGTFQNTSSFNLIGDDTGSSNLVDGVNGNLVGDNASPIDAMLEALADNGGFANTHALQSSSVAINAGTSSGAPAIDQRGVMRDSTPDIGAYESTASNFWLSTNGNVSSSGAPGLGSWQNGEVIELSDPDFQLNPGTTNGTFTSALNVETLAGIDLDVDGLHYVTRNITLGTTHTVSLQTGDLLISTRGSENLGAITVDDSDVFMFRPNSSGDYTSGTFSHVLSGLDALADPDLNGMTDLWAFSLVEHDTTFGDTELKEGDFLFSQEGANGNNIYIFNTVDVGDGTTDGTAEILVDGDDIGITVAIDGLELIETTKTLGDETIVAGELLVTLSLTDNGIGTSTISVEDEDIFRLQVAETTLVAGTAVADASLLLDGSEINLDSTDEDLDAIALVPSAVNTVGGITISERDEFRVNDTVGDQQQTSGENRGSKQAVSMASDGSYVVTWSSLNQDGSGQGVYARRFSASGMALTAEILVNQSSTNDQQWAHVESAADGTFVVTWTSNHGANQDIYYRRFGADGSALTVELIANDTTTGDQGDSSIAMAADGSFVIVWEGEGPGDNNGVFAKRFDATGTALDATDIAINSTAVGSQSNAAVAMKSNGDFVVAWQSGDEIYARMFDADGISSTGEVRIDTAGSASYPDITYHESGEFTVVWRSDVPFVSGLYHRRFDADGNALDSSQNIAYGDDTNASITNDDIGNYIVVWQSSVDGDGDGVFARKYDASGSSLGAMFQINQTTSLNQNMASVAMANTSNYVVIWSGNGDQTGQVDTGGVFARQFGVMSSAPTDILPNSFTIDELTNTSGGVSLGTLTATDPDAGDTFTYSIVSGFDSSKFSILGDQLMLDDGILDFETKSQYVVVVRVTDSTSNTYQEQLSISVNDVNETPSVSLSSNTSSLPENADTSSATMVATITIEDDALGSESLYLSGSDASLFEISGNQLRMVSGASLDFESNPSLDVTVNVEDSSIGSDPDATSSHTVTITDINDETPQIDPNQEFSVEEDAVVGASLGFVSATDDDTVGTLGNWEITGGNTGGVFEIDASTGELRVLMASLDHESNPTYSLSVKMDDGVSTSANQSVVINVVDVAEVNALWFSTSGDVTASGNPDLTAWDEDQILQYGGAGLNFEPNGGTTTGALSTAGFKASNFGAAANVRVEAMHFVWSDLTVGTGGNTFDLQEGDILLSFDQDNVTLTSESEANKTFDKNDVFVFRAVTTGDYSQGDFFHLLDDPLTTGQIRGISLVENQAGVTVGDTNLAQGTFLLVRDGVDEQDRIYTFNATSVGQLNTAGTDAILLEGADLIETANGGNLNMSGRFDGIHLVASTNTLGNSTLQKGDILVSTYQSPTIAGTAVDNHDISILRMSTTRIGDDHSTGSVTILFDASDESMESTAEDIDSLTLVEGASASHSVGPISDANTSAANELFEDAAANADTGIRALASDVDPSDDVTYSLDDDAGNRFQIDPGTGVVTLKTSLNYEDETSHDIVVRATSYDTSFQTISFTIAVIDVNDVVPVVDPSQSFNVDEDADNMTSIGFVSVTDPDTVGALTNWTITHGNSDGIFAINNSTGELSVVDNTSLDFETTPNYTLSITVSDGTNNSVVETVSISVVNKNDAPTVSLSANTGSINEDADTSTAITLATITINDDALGTESLSLSGDDASQFEIVGNELRLAAGATLDFETKPSLDVSVDVDDTTIVGTPDDSADFLLTVVDVNEAASLTLVPIVSAIPENTVLTSSVRVADINVSDDANGTNTTTLSGADASLFELQNGNTELHLKSGVTLDAETKPTLNVTVSVDDPSVTGTPDDTSTYTINIQNVNDEVSGTPTIEGDSTTGQTLIARTDTIEDQDGLGPFSYQWFRNGTSITGATSDQYTTTTADAGSQIHVEVSFVDGSGYTEGPLQSDAILALAAPPLPTPPPGASGTNGGENSPPEGGGEQQNDSSGEDQSENQESSEDSGSSKSENSNPYGAPPPEAISNLNRGLGDAKSSNELILMLMQNAAQGNQGRAFLESTSLTLDGEIATDTARDNRLRVSETTSLEPAIVITDAQRFDSIDGLTVHDISILTGPGELWSAMDVTQEEIHSAIRNDLIVAGTAGAAASSFLVIAVTWAARSGLVVYGLFAQLPIWRGIDPLTVIQGLDAGEDGESLEELMQRRSDSLEKSDQSEQTT